MKFLRAFIVFVIFVTFFFMLAQGFVYLNRWYIEHTADAAEPLRQPFLHTGDYQPIDSIEVGGVYFLNLRAHRDHTCRYEVFNRLTRFDADHNIREVVFAYPMIASYSTTGNYEWNEIFHVPDYLPPGHYEHLRVTFYECIPGIKLTEHWPVLPLDVLPKPKR